MSGNQNVGCYSNITLNNAVDIYREMTVWMLHPQHLPIQEIHNISVIQIQLLEKILFLLKFK
jgi:hypothetical protein